MPVDQWGGWTTAASNPSAMTNSAINWSDPAVQAAASGFPTYGAAGTGSPLVNMDTLLPAGGPGASGWSNVYGADVGPGEGGWWKPPQSWLDGTADSGPPAAALPALGAAGLGSRGIGQFLPFLQALFSNPGGLGGLGGLSGIPAGPAPWSATNAWSAPGAPPPYWDMPQQPMSQNFNPLFDNPTSALAPQNQNSSAGAGWVPWSSAGGWQ